MNTMRRFSAKPLSWLAVPLLLIPVACKRAAPVADDSSLAAAVQSRLSADTAIASEPIQTSVQNGVVTLNGAVSSNAARALAASDAAQVIGVRTVVNDLSVQTAASAEPPAVTSPSPTPEPAVSRADRKRAARADRKLNRGKVSPPPPDQQVSNTVPPPAPVVVEPPAASPSPPPPPPAPVTRNVAVPTGTILPVRITQTLDSATTQQGDSFSGSIASDVVIEGITVLRQGTPVSGRVTAVQEAAHFKGNSLLSIELSSVNRRGEPLAVSTEAYSAQGKGRGTNTAEKVGGGAAVGAILGGIFGGGKGAGIGAAAGGGLGAGANGITRGQQVQIPAESMVRFRLTSPVTVRVSGPANPTEASPSLEQRHPLN